MKKLFILLAVFIAGSVNLAAEELSDYFPQFYSKQEFYDLDSAFDYISEAQKMVSRASNKKSAKGLAAKLEGPEIKQKAPVMVSGFLVAYDRNGKFIDFETIDKPLESVLKTAVSVYTIFLVFHKGQGVALSRFLLAPGYRFNSNSQYKTFNFSGEKYTAYYPPAWGDDKAKAWLDSLPEQIVDSDDSSEDDES